MARKTEQEMFPLIAEWESSNQTRELFCQEKGLSLATFSYWRTRYRSWQCDADEFTEIKPKLTGNLTITYPNGVRIEIPASLTPMATIQALVHLV